MSPRNRSRDRQGAVGCVPARGQPLPDGRGSDVVPDRGHASRRAVLALFALLAAGCTAARGPALTAQQVSAAEACCRQRPLCDLPPHPFTTDVCTLWPDGDWGACCVEHDVAYWCGGSDEARSAADERFRQCVAARTDAVFAAVSWFGVRVGGAAWLPTAWRWGYGWDWLDDRQRREH